MLALAIASFSSATSWPCRRLRPSWRWMVAICSRSIASRWRSSNAALVCWPISWRQAQHLDALGEEARDLVHARREVDRLQDLLLLLRLDVHVGGREIGQRAGEVVALERRDQFLRRLRQELHRLDGLTSAD